jgi:hypothetical protein
VRPGLVLLTNVQIEDKHEAAAKSLMFCQDNMAQGICAGNTNLWGKRDAFNKKHLTLPMPPKAVQVIKHEKI